MIPKNISVDSNTRLRVQHDLRRGGGDQKQEERGGAGEGDHPGDGWGLTNSGAGARVVTKYAVTVL